MTDLERMRIDWIDRSHVRCGQTVDVVETDVAGGGRVEFHLGNGGSAFAFDLSRDRRFPCIRQRKVADGVVLQFDARKRLQAIHLVELKSRLTLERWNEVKQQFQGALHNAHALLGVLGLAMPQQIVCHTAYTDDAISPNPVLLKSPVGGRAQATGTDWLSNTISIDSRGPHCLHRRHRRDASGNAAAIL